MVDLSDISPPVALILSDHLSNPTSFRRLAKAQAQAQAAAFDPRISLPSQLRSQIFKAIIRYSFHAETKRQTPPIQRHRDIGTEEL